MIPKQKGLTRLLKNQQHQSSSLDFRPETVKGVQHFSLPSNSLIKQGSVVETMHESQMRTFLEKVENSAKKRPKVQKFEPTQKFQ